MARLPSLPASRYPVISNFLTSISPLETLKMVIIGGVLTGGLGKVNESKLASFWLGTLTCLSIEAVVKFAAPTMKREVGFDVGRHVFSAVQRFEWILAVMWIGTWSDKVNMGSDGLSKFAAATPIVVLCWQTIFGLPALVTRALDIMGGSPAVDSGLNHRLYVGAEFLKMIVLGLVASGLA